MGTQNPDVAEAEACPLTTALTLNGYLAPSQPTDPAPWYLDMAFKDTDGNLAWDMVWDDWKEAFSVACSLKPDAFETHRTSHGFRNDRREVSRCNGRDLGEFGVSIDSLGNNPDNEDVLFLESVIRGILKDAGIEVPMRGDLKLDPSLFDASRVPLAFDDIAVTDTEGGYGTFRPYVPYMENREIIDARQYHAIPGSRTWTAHAVRKVPVEPLWKIGIVLDDGGITAHVREHAHELLASRVRVDLSRPGLISMVPPPIRKKKT